MSAFINNPLPNLSSASASTFLNAQRCAVQPRSLPLLSPRTRRNAANNDVLTTPSMVASKEKPDDKSIVTEYFNNKGFDRWNRIYSDTDTTVNKVQLDIREGHAQTIDKVIGWLKSDADPNVSSETFCDAGCGVGSLTLPLLDQIGVGKVFASDISKAMVTEAEKRIAEVNPDFISDNRVSFQVQDLESISGNYDTVCCIDVMIHYPSEKVGEMIEKLSNCSNTRLIISFAPKTFFLSILKKVGEFFPGPSKATRAYLHSEEDIVKAIKKCGLKVKRTEFTGTRFYFSKLIEAVKED